MNAKRYMQVFLTTLSMYLVTHLLVFLLLPYGILMALLAPKVVPDLKERFTGWLFGIVGKRLKVSGLEHVQAGKDYLIIANYPSFYAGFALIHVFPRAGVVANAFIQRIPLLGAFMKRIGTIFVTPKKGRRSVRAIDMGLSQGEAGSIIIFPEGERTADGSIHRFKRGFIYILRGSSLDLLPVTLKGFYRLKPVKRMTLDPDAQPEVVIHPPLDNATAREMDDKELLATAMNSIQSGYVP